MHQFIDCGRRRKPVSKRRLKIQSRRHTLGIIQRAIDVLRSPVEDD